MLVFDLFGSIYFGQEEAGLLGSAAVAASYTIFFFLVTVFFVVISFLFKIPSA